VDDVETDVAEEPPPVSGQLSPITTQQTTHDDAFTHDGIAKRSVFIAVVFYCVVRSTRYI